MNILLIDHYAGTPAYGMEYRPYHLGKEWVQEGNKVIVLGGSYSHTRKTQPQVGPENIDGVDFYWVKTNKYNGNGIGRILSMFIFVMKFHFCYKKYLMGVKPDVVIASSTYPLDIYPSRRIAKKYKAKLIYELHDLWPLSPIELGGYSEKHPFIRVMQKAEDYCYRHSDAVVSLLPLANKHIKDRGFEEVPFYCVPNGIVLSDWENPINAPAEHRDLFQRLHEEKQFVVCYTGAHGLANSLYAIIDAVGTLKKENVSLVLVGTGQEKEKLLAYSKEKKYENVYFLPPVDKRAIPNILSQADVLYVGLQRQSLFRFGISPNKMYDYMMASKPIIQAIDAGNNMVEDANCGFYAEPENANAISEAILKLKNLGEEGRMELGNNGHEYVLANHSYQVLAQRFLDIMKGLK